MSSVNIHHISLLEALDQNLKRFWELEDLPGKVMLTPEEQKCESHFRETHTRTPEGRYVVRLPFKTDPPIELGESRLGALRSLRSQENRLHQNQTTYQEYCNFLSEYESLGHMREINQAHITSNNPTYYIPHHAVFRSTSATTRLRVVFNASRRTSNGKSLNDHLLSGPKLQKDLAAILGRWRQFQYVYTTDIAKMYRQILIDSRDRDFQRILWRNDQTDPVKEYQLLTVTYGTTSAPYLALRFLQQLNQDAGFNYPDASYVLNNQAYVDDFLFGGDSIQSLRHIRNQTIELLKRGGFSLRKWASNDSTLLSDIDPTDHGLALSKSLNATETVSVLGLIWNPALDSFSVPSSNSNQLRIYQTNNPVCDYKNFRSHGMDRPSCNINKDSHPKAMVSELRMGRSCPPGKPHKMAGILSATSGVRKYFDSPKNLK
ncbi:uncharacterized protein LOC143305757 [Osmia lignaria lignaria]|uniref:uncharacterized protein LOC143305757 n=1 Tax=Osmia lignaria lignaria TaxID=1437193 RepID=UPI00402BCA97